MPSCLDVSDWWGLGHIHTWTIQTTNKLVSRQKLITMTGVKQEKTVETDSWIPVPHACNPRYSGCKDQYGSRQAGTNSSRDPMYTIPNKKRFGGVAQVVRAHA
jgi:hypothetical protein